MSQASSVQSKIDVSQISLKDVPERPFAAGGEPPFRVAVSPQAYESIRQHARENTHVEICGVLVGGLARDRQGPHLEVTSVIRGEHAEAKAGQVTFTQETWEHVNGIMASQHPGQRVVGWYHSHPGYGVFLSPQDEFIQVNFFNQAWQVAFVIDPVTEEDGFFIWQQGSPVRMRQYWIGGEKKTYSADLASLRTGMNNALEEIRRTLPKSQRKGLRLVPFLIGILLLGVMMVASLLQARRYYQQLARLQEMAIKQNIHLPLPTEDLVRRLKENERLTGLEARLVRLGPFVWCEGRVLTHAQKELVARVLRSVEGVQSVDVSGLQVTHEYTVTAGETLNAIAHRVYGDAARWKDIFDANRDQLDDPARLTPYLKLRLPE